jgi:excinuclease ABC subunit C
VIVPRRGDKRGLVEMVAKSAEENLEQSRLKFLSDEMKTTASMTELADALDLPRMPRRIECFDISNIQGTNPVASMVVFEEGKPAKKEYRRFTIKTVVGANDFAMMNEVIKRRFKRAVEANEDEQGKWTKLPDLVIIDGGKGQLNAALAALDEVGASVPICGLAKENEEIFLPGRFDSILLPRDSQALYLVQRVRDEAHRFAVTFHRTRRNASRLTTELARIPGIGEKTSMKLLREFGSLERVKEASEDDLATHIGRAAARKLRAALMEEAAPQPSSEFRIF